MNRPPFPHTSHHGRKKNDFFFFFAKACLADTLLRRTQKLPCSEAVLVNAVARAGKENAANDMGVREFIKFSYPPSPPIPLHPTPPQSMVQCCFLTIPVIVCSSPAKGSFKEVDEVG